MSELRRVTVRAVATGKLGAAVSQRKAPELACLEGERVLWGDEQLTVRQLPTLRTVWSLKTAARVEAVAATKTEIAYQQADSIEVFTVPLPGAGRTTPSSGRRPQRP